MADQWSQFPDASGKASVADDPFAHFPDATAPQQPKPEPTPQGQLEPGNIDLAAPPVVKSKSGDEMSTLRSMSIERNGKEILIPMVAHNGSGILSKADAIKQFDQSGKHLGIFDSPENATVRANTLSEIQAKRYGVSVGPTGFDVNKRFNEGTIDKPDEPVPVPTPKESLGKVLSGVAGIGAEGEADASRPAFNPRGEQIRASTPSERHRDAVGQFLDWALKPGHESGINLIPPDVAKAGVDVAAFGPRFLGKVLGGGVPELVEGGVEATKEAAGQFGKLENVGALLSLAIPGVAEAYATQAANQLPEQYGRIKEAIQKHGVMSRETGKAAADAGISDIMAFLGLKTAGRFEAAPPVSLDKLSPQQIAEIAVPDMKGGETSAEGIPKDESKIPAPGPSKEAGGSEGRADLEQQAQGRTGSGPGEVAQQQKNVPVPGEGGAQVAQGDVDELTRSNRERLGLSTEGLPGEMPTAPEGVQAPAEPAPSSPHDFTPALKTKDGQIIPGEKGKVHQDIYNAQEDPVLLRAEEPEHGFIDSKTGEFKSREQVSEALGEKEPMQSERLRDLQKQVPEEPTAPKAETKPTEAQMTEPPSAAAPETQPSAPVAEEPKNDWTEATLPSLKTEPTAAEPAAAQPLGIVPPGTGKILTWHDELKTALKGLLSSTQDLAKFSDFRKAVLKWSALNQKSAGEIFKATKEIQASVPDPVRREAITNWIQAGGDTAELQRRAGATKDVKLKSAYEAAANLTPEEVALAGKIRQTYDILLKRARAYGIEINELPDYVNQIWRRNPIKDFLASSNRRLSTSIRFAKERYYDSFFHGEQAGLTPSTKDISKLLPIYMNEVNNAIAAKQFVADMAGAKASDGRPLLASTGMVKTIDTAEGQTHLVLPDMRAEGTEDYKALDNHPALKSWRWRGQDENGNPIMVQGDLRIHPEAYSHLKNVLGTSAIREWYRSASENPLGDIPKAVTKFLIDDLNQIAKGTMLGFLSPFHQVQEGTHAIGHRVNPFGAIPKIDFSKAETVDAAQHGLMLLPDRVSAGQFREGLDGSRRNLVSTMLGKGPKPAKMLKEWADNYQDYLFHEYIPGLKLKTYEHILPRNMERYADQIGRGDVTEDQVKYLSAQQANAAYGHLNYADMGRNPTMQHLMQTFLLAPDFLEARGRFVGQALKPSLAGREQLAALATLAATQYVLSRTLNKTLDDDYHWDSPFDVIVGNRRYGMRSVPADVAHAFSNTRQFVSGRLSPIVGRGLLEGLSGVNYRREPTTAGQTLSDILTGMIPITLQPATRGLSETGKDNPVSPFEQFLGSMGLHVSRFSPLSKAYFLAHDWVDKHGSDYGINKTNAIFPISKYQQFRYALEDGNIDAARTEYDKLIKAAKIGGSEFSKRFRMSLYHPFTGSEKTDDIFKQSLKEGDRKLVDDATKRRDIIWSRYESIAGMSSQPAKRKRKFTIVQ
jgi:hypothetical protein